MIARWFSRREAPEEAAARALYIAIVEQARREPFYRTWGVPDTLDGRFELIVLHVFLVLRRLKQEPERAGGLGQGLFDVLFRDMDASLREMGVGDLSVGKKVKAMAEAFYGRVSSYETALEASGEAPPPSALERALERNLLGTVEASSAQLAALAGYVSGTVQRLEAQPLDEIAGGSILFPDLPDFEDSL